AWPVADAGRIDPAAEAGIAELQSVVLDVRRFRSDQGVKPAQRIPARLTGIERYAAELSTGSGRIELDLSTAIDVSAERARLTKDLAAAHKELEQTGRKLANEKFLANAKPQVVSSIRD